MSFPSADPSLPSQGLFAGLVPTLHHHFFDKDGIFRAWLTVSLSTVGNMFAGTQVIIVGLKVLGIRVGSVGILLI